MLGTLVVLLDFVFIVVGIYLFDYKVDGIIDNPFAIIIVLLLSIIFSLLFLYLYIEILYVLVARKKPITSKLKHYLANQFVILPLHIMNMRFKVVGKENLPKETGFTIYSNHTSMFDIPVLMVALHDYPVAFLAKKVVGSLFAVGKWAISLGCVLIDRGNDRKSAESIIQVIKQVRNGSTMVIFPEGTRQKEIGKLLPFKPGSFKVALKSRAPLVPVSIVKPENYNSIRWPFMKKETIVIHKPIPYQEIKNMKSHELAEKVQNIIQQEIQIKK